MPLFSIEAIFVAATIVTFMALAELWYTKYPVTTIILTASYVRQGYLAWRHQIGVIPYIMLTLPQFWYFSEAHSWMHDVIFGCCLYIFTIDYVLGTRREEPQSGIAAG